MEVAQVRIFLAKVACMLATKWDNSLLQVVYPFQEAFLRFGADSMMIKCKK